ncbi:hypothetical protein CDAR_502231 [Caerostris darwini]|uniref:Uncharacterized protein n=1 Tax=Caerostris darwini TaxID=1538125 RepID=A0AAV4R5X4_9ARAC|nr:hypothetical protein CDAR_502231 [Caerostris darwini]
MSRSGHRALRHTVWWFVFSVVKCSMFWNSVLLFSKKMSLEAYGLVVRLLSSEVLCVLEFRFAFVKEDGKALYVKIGNEENLFFEMG